jgi:hypothetical protein
VNVPKERIKPARKKLKKRRKKARLKEETKKIINMKKEKQ